MWIRKTLENGPRPEAEVARRLAEMGLAHLFRPAAERLGVRCRRGEWAAGVRESLAENRPLRGRHFGAVVTTRKQVPVAVGGPRDQRMPEPGLYYIERQFEPTIGFPVDAPARLEVAQRVHAGIFDLAVLGDESGLDHGRLQPAGQNVCQLLDLAGAVRKHEIAGRAGQLPLAQNRRQHRRQRHRARAGARLRRAYYLPSVGSLVNVDRRRRIATQMQKSRVLLCAKWA
jgi:hypothetical protein